MERDFSMERKKHLLISAPLAALLLCDMAIAATSAELRITGKILPSSCEVLTLPTVAYGDIPLSSLNPDKPTRLGDKFGSVYINCNAPAQVALKLVDNRPGTASDQLIVGRPIGKDNVFGLGLDSTGNPVGHYNLMFVGSKIDKRDTTMIVSYDATNWTPTDMGAFSINAASWMMSWGDAGTPEPMMSATQQFAITSVVAPTRTLNTTAEIKLDGSLTFELVYL